MLLAVWNDSTLNISDKKMFIMGLYSGMDKYTEKMEECDFLYEILGIKQSLEKSDKE